MRLLVLLEDADPLQNAYLGSREADAVRVVHQLAHPLQQPAQVFVEALDVARPHPQDRIGILPDLCEREPPARLRLGVELLVARELSLSLVIGHGASVVGSTRTALA